jgi:hypothetical protein
MSSTALSAIRPTRVPWARIAQSTIAVALLDGLFAIGYYVVILRLTTATRVWQSVASKVLGPSAYTGGAATVALGLLMHVSVALSWTLIFLVAVRRSSTLRRVLASRFGAVKVAVWYGPLVHIVMTCVVIPVMVHRAPTITSMWIVGLLGHIPFVGLPIASIAGKSAATD